MKRPNFIFNRALQKLEKAFGPDHSHVAISLEYHAQQLYNLGNYTKAEPLLTRALAIQEKQLGPNHQDVADILENLARIIDAQGRFEEAEPLKKQALEIRKGKSFLYH